MNRLNLMSFEMFFVPLNLTFYKTTEKKFEDDIQMKKGLISTRSKTKRFRGECSTGCCREHGLASMISLRYTSEMSFCLAKHKSYNVSLN